MSGTREDGWGSASFYGPGLLTVEPPSAETRLNPIPAVVVQPWQQDAAADERWSSVTYVGRGRRDPAERPAPADSGDRGVLASSRLMAIASLASRITGLLRSVAIATALGLMGVGDAYNAANNFPNSVYELLLGGVLSSVLIPLLVRAREHDSDGGEAYTARLLSIATLALAVMTVAAVLCAPLLADFFVHHDPAKQHLTTTFAYLLLPEIFFYGLSAMFTAILNTRNVYAPGAWAPVLNNVITLATLGVFLALPGPKSLNPATITSTQVLVIGIGTTLGIVGQALILLPYLRRAGFSWRWRFRAGEHDQGRLSEVGGLTAWVLGYVVASQIGVVVIQKVGLAVDGSGGLTKFVNADLLFQVPYGIIGVSLLTALMPRMSQAAARGDTPGLLADMTLGARLSAVALVPITAGLIVLAPSLTTVLYLHGTNTLASARDIGMALALASFGLLPFALVMLQLRVFYAIKDARTPTLINVFMVGTKVVLVLLAEHLLSGRQAVEALNVSTSLSYVVGALVGHVLLTRRIGRLGFSAVLRTIIRIGIASAIGGAVAYLTVWIVEHNLGRAVGGSLAGLVAGSLLGLAVMGMVAWRMRLPELREVRAALGR